MQLENFYCSLFLNGFFLSKVFTQSSASTSFLICFHCMSLSLRSPNALNKPITVNACQRRNKVNLHFNFELSRDLTKNKPFFKEPLFSSFCSVLNNK